uniref:Uncharacterized protein n=1 Tax=Megaselia scalaris TaxID=36166 RepID=T1GEW9_MEGSC
MWATTVMVTDLILVVSLLGVTFGQHNPWYKPGHTIIVHLFDWAFNDVARECEDFLGPNGFGGVQVSPVQEHAIVPGRPWYERYQPVSYEINCRSGNEEEFKEMVERLIKLVLEYMLMLL